MLAYYLRSLFSANLTDTRTVPVNDNHSPIINCSSFLCSASKEGND